MKTRIITLLSVLLGIQFAFAQSINKRDVLTTKNPDKIYIGAIMKASSMNEDNYQILTVPLNPITISYSFPARSADISPSYTNMMNAISNGLKSIGTPKQISSFGYSINEMKSYGELAFYFGQNVNTDNLLGVSSKTKKHKTLAIADLTLGSYTVDIDFPEELCADPRALEPFAGEELIYIISVTFGRRVMIIVESDYDYADVRAAIQYTIRKSGNDTMDIEPKNEAIFANSSIRILTIGNEDLGVSDPNKPLSHLISYLNRKVTADDFGIPISFSASYLKNPGLFINEFTIEQ